MKLKLKKILQTGCVSTIKIEGLELLGGQYETFIFENNHHKQSEIRREHSLIGAIRNHVIAIYYVISGKVHDFA